MTTWRESTGAAPAESFRARSGIVVSRYQGTVVVSIHGDLDGPRAADLDYMLADLIDGQGNRSVIVDLRDATAMDPQWLSLFTDAVADYGEGRGGSPPVFGSMRFAGHAAGAR
ncbi:MAG TPA: hypothetical protein VNT52_11985, partial [Acidimicrobiales bacterium]|nr:hypothetical protein [Acidimicrobiales bacterium]